MAAAMLAELILEEIPATNPDRAGMTRLVNVARDDCATLAEYRRWRDRTPQFSAALAHAGRAHDERTQMRLAGILMGDICDSPWE
jgi:hypothetical protein